MGEPRGLAPRVSMRARRRPWEAPARPARRARIDVEMLLRYADGLAAMDVFTKKYGAKYPKAVECLTKDRQTRLAVYDFPAQHWDHLRTSNPIESVFSTVRHRTVRTQGSLSSAIAKLMLFKLIMAASNPLASSGLAAVDRRKANAESHRRCQIHRRYRGHRSAVTKRRLIGPSPKIPHSSLTTRAPPNKPRKYRNDGRSIT